MKNLLSLFVYTFKSLCYLPIVTFSRYILRGISYTPFGNLCNLTLIPINRLHVNTQLWSLLGTLLENFQYYIGNLSILWFCLIENASVNCRLWSLLSILLANFQYSFGNLSNLSFCPIKRLTFLTRCKIRSLHFKEAPAFPWGI